MIFFCHSVATPPGLRVGTPEHLAAVLQRELARQRGQHGLVLRRRHQHVVRAVLDHGPVALG